VAVGVLLTAACTVGAAPRAVAAVPLGTPAFYTWQAPYGESTAGQRVVALTFDDGPSIYTPGVLSVLQQYHVPGTFFEVGEEVAARPDLTKLLASAGESVQDHTWNHPDLTTIPISAFPYQIDQTQNLIASLTGTAPICVRPPYDAFNGTVLNQLAIRGLTTMSYSVDSSDWTRPGVQAIVDHVVGAAFPGAVIGMHDGGGDRSETVAALPQIITDLEARGYSFVSLCAPPPPPPPPPPQTSAVYSFGSAPTPGAAITSRVAFSGVAYDPTSGGYWLNARDGGIFAFAGAGFFGSLPGLGITPAAPMTALAATHGGQGYWQAASDGGVFAFGSAGFFGSMGGKPLNRPVVGIAGAPDGQGYWEVASDGGVFAFGSAGFFGSMGGKPLNRPVVGIAGAPDGQGYWEVASDGGVFAFGSAGYYGSMGGRPLNQPVVGIAATSDGKGYWEVASDGGVFAFGDATFHGSMGGTVLNEPVTGIATDPATGGYWMVAQDGGVFAFDAPFYGSRGGAGGPDRFFGITATAGGAGYLLAAQHDAS
jgi:peptidoglycan/xylan/chitin deacetylase (PgdA/CDA1 family)